MMRHVSVSAKPVVFTIDITNESDSMIIIVQPSKRQPEKISIWLKDYKFGDLMLDEVIKVIMEQVTTALKNAGYEKPKRMPKIGDTVAFKRSVGDIGVGENGTIVNIEPERPYPYVVKVRETEIFARLDDFELL